LNRRFAGFVAAEARSAFGDLLARAFETKAPQSGVVALSIEGQPRLTVLLQASVTGDDQECRVVMTDLTERTREDETFHLSQQRLSLKVEQTPLAVIEFDVEGRVREWNPAAVAVFGYSREEAIGEHWRFIVPAVLHGQLDGVWASLVGQHGGHRSTNENITKEGRTISCEWFNRPLIARDGRTVGVASLIEDVTERKQAEEALKRAHARLQCFVDSNIVGIVIANSAGAVIEANDYYLRLIGFTRHELEQGKVVWRAITPPQWLPADERAIRELRERGACTPYEKEYVRRDGRRVPILLASTLLPGPEEELAAFVLDLTERRRGEAALRASEEEFRAMFDMASIGIAQADPRTGQWLRVNAKMCEITGYSASELLQMRVADIPQAEDRKPDWDAFQRVVRGEARDYRMEKRYVRKDGSLAWVNVNMTVLRDAAGKPMRTMATIEDVTERKLAELRIAAFADLGRRLGAARSPAEAARAIFASADQFWKWDSGALDLQVPESQQMETALAYDLVDGQRREVPLPDPVGPPSAMNGRIMAQGAELILRKLDEPPATDTTRFGDASRLSASLMCVPVRAENRAVGVLSIQSYTPDAYTEEDLCTLQTLADHCGGALDRLQKEELLRSSEVRYRRLFEAAKDGVLILDAKTGMVVDVNPFLVQLLGSSREALFRKKVWELEYFKDIVANEANFETFRQEESIRYDNRPLKTADGRRIDVELVSSIDQVDHQKVIQCNIRDITARKRTEWLERIYKDQLRALSARIETMREEERTRISRQIHDELGQMLTGIKMDLRWMEHRLDEFGEDRRVNPILDKLVVATELTDATIKIVQRIAAELRPGMLDKLGLPITLQYEADRFQERTGIACRLAVPGEALPLPPEAATAFFRIFQEALTNVARHAKATAVEAELQPEAEGYRLEIRDNGQGMVGIDPAQLKSLGLLGMQERAALLGGDVSFAARPGGGTVVTIRIPNRPASKGGV